MKFKGLVLGFFFLAPALTLAAPDECLNLPAVFKEIDKSLDGGGKLVQGLSDVFIKEGEKNITEKWLVRHGDGLLGQNKLTQATIKQFAKKVDQKGCKKVSHLVALNNESIDLLIEAYTPQELKLRLDGDAAVEVLAKSIENGTTGTAEYRKATAEAFREKKATIAEMLTDSFQWTLRKSKEGQLTSTYLQIFGDAEVGKVVGESTFEIRWGGAPEPIKPSARAENLLEDWAAAKRHAANPKQID